MAALRREQAAPVFTVGHSNRSIAAFLELLDAHGIALLVDVRSYPRSRHNPQFDREALGKALAAAAIAYRHRPGLGGRRKARPDSPNQGWRNAGFRAYADHMQSEVFAREIDALAEIAGTVRTAVMCAEALPWRCHRWLIADALLIRGHRVHHILAPERADDHRLSSFAEVHGARITYPFALSAPGRPGR